MRRHLPHSRYRRIRGPHFLLDNSLRQEYKDQPQGAASRLALKGIVTIAILGRYSISYRNPLFGIALGSARGAEQTFGPKNHGAKSVHPFGSSIAEITNTDVAQLP